MKSREKYGRLSISRGHASWGEGHVAIELTLDGRELIVRMNLTLDDFANVVTGRVLDRVRVELHEPDQGPCGVHPGELRAPCNLQRGHDGPHRVVPCHESIVGTQNLCTQIKGHDGPHRCSAEDVDARKFANG